MDFKVGDIVLLPIIVGLVEVVKRVVPEAYKDSVTRVAPVISLGLGVVAGFVYIAPQDPGMAVLSGIVMGLSASGLYSGSKSIVGK